jgi:hypothetical protein
MPEAIEQRDIDLAEAAIAGAQRTRKYHARRTQKSSSQRKQDLDIGMDALKEAMRPIRSALARLPSRQQTEAVKNERRELRSLSERIQKERRKLWKMRKAW